MTRENERITSRDNRRLIDARRARDGKSDDRIFIEGKRLVGEALRSNISGVEAFVSDSFADTDLIEKLRAANIGTHRVADSLFKSISDTVETQGIVFIARRPNTRMAFDSHLTNAGVPLFLFLYEISNPSNFGAILRTAEAAGVAGVIVSTRSADVFSPKALRGAMGSAFRMPIWGKIAPEDVLRWAKAQKLVITAAEASASKSYWDIDWRVPRLLVLGSEAHGLRGEISDRGEEKIAIPMANGVESLNLAMSAGIILFEAARQAQQS